MFRLKHDDHEYEVRFCHTVLEPNEVQSWVKDINLCEGRVIPNLINSRRSTIARIFSDKRLVRLGASICNPEDNFCRATGRKLALTKALCPFSKELRSAIWAEYHKRCK